MIYLYMNGCVSVMSKVMVFSSEIRFKDHDLDYAKPRLQNQMVILISSMKLNCNDLVFILYIFTFWIFMIDVWYLDNGVHVLPSVLLANKSS